jgi:hypothetical protein
MSSCPRRLSLRVAALTFSAAGAVLMGYGGATGAPVATRPASVRASTADTATHERRCATPTPAARHGRGDATRCGHASHGTRRDPDRERPHASRDHGSHVATPHGQDPTPAAAAGHLTGAETRDPGCGDADNGGMNCSGDSGADRGAAHLPSGASTGRVRASAPAPASDPGGGASSAGRPAPPEPEPPATSPASAGVSAAAVPPSGSHAPVVPVTGTVAGIAGGLLLCLAGLLGMAYSRRHP